MIKVRSIRAEEIVLEEFSKLSDEEGRKQGKMLEILIKFYKENNNKTTQEQRKLR